MTSKLQQIYTELTTSYKRMDPHHETWQLWIKENKNDEEFFEVAIGTILVQNTNWHNVNKAISNLRSNSLFTFTRIVSCNHEKLESVIQPAGFYKQKSRYLKALGRFLENRGRDSIPSRNELITIEGVGNETADSILCYCYNQAVPIIGTYTRRLFARVFLRKEFMEEKYRIIQDFMIKELGERFEPYGRFHALVVCHAQNICQKNRPKCEICTLTQLCKFASDSAENKLREDIQFKIAKPFKKKK